MNAIEIKRKINICNDMIKTHIEEETLSSKNAIACWTIRKRKLQQHLLKK